MNDYNKNNLSIYEGFILKRGKKFATCTLNRTFPSRSGGQKRVKTMAWISLGSFRGSLYNNSERWNPHLALLFKDLFCNLNKFIIKDSLFHELLKNISDLKYKLSILGKVKTSSKMIYSKNISKIIIIWLWL